MSYKNPNYHKEYISNPENKTRRKKYEKEYFLNPENKARRKKWEEEYYNKPETKAKLKKYRDEFYKKNKDRITKRQKKYREDNLERLKKRDKEYYYKHHSKRLEANKNRRETLKNFIYQYKKKRGCKKCGYNKYPEILEFHHNKGIKKFKISSQNHLSVKLVKLEIKKCIVLCPNCHRIIHKDTPFGVKASDFRAELQFKPLTEISN